MYKTPEITRLIHNNFWTVMAFALSRSSVNELLEKRFAGEWKYLRKSFYEMAEVRADRALLEMGTQLRVIDDDEQIGDYLEQTKGPPFGTVTQGDGTVTELHFRDMTNKILHAATFGWDFSDPQKPNEKRWKRAEIDLLRLSMFVGTLMF